MENLLTDSEIYKILNHNINNPVFKYKRIILGSRENESPTDVIVLSYKKDLIMIRGNDDTGLEHIRARHNFWSRRAYTVENPNESKRIQNQSKFPEDITLFDELRIAEEIYRPENLVIDNPHKMAEKFDLYVGESVFDKNEKEKVKLLLYKGTKILHTLFPVNAKYSRKKLKNFPFYRGKVEVFKHPTTGIKQVMIPYHNLDKEHCYGIFIEKFEDENKEIISLVTCINDGNNFRKRELIEREMTYFETDTHERITYQYTDLREVEKLILETENYKNSN